MFKEPDFTYVCLMSSVEMYSILKNATLYVVNIVILNEICCIKLQNSLT